MGRHEKFVPPNPPVIHDQWTSILTYTLSRQALRVPRAEVHTADGGAFLYQGWSSCLGSR
jgi:hypothetical protein